MKKQFLDKLYEEKHKLDERLEHLKTFSDFNDTCKVCKYSESDAFKRDIEQVQGFLNVVNDIIKNYLIDYYPSNNQ